MVRYWHILLLLLSLTYGHANAANLRAVKVLNTDQVINIDGKIDESAWQKASWQSDFVLLRQINRSPQQPTRFKMLADQHYLYLAIEAFETQTANLKKDAVEHDGKVYQDDCLELFIAPDTQTGEYFYFAVNPRGTVLDMHVIQNGHLKIPDFNCYALQCKTSIMPDRWCVEMALPWHELNMQSFKGKMGFNLVRERYTGNEEISSFQAVERDLHMLENLGDLSISGIDFAQYRWDLKPLYNIHTAAGKNNRIFLYASTYLVNNTGKMRFASLHYSVGNGKAKSRTIMLDSGQGRELVLELPLEKTKGKQPLRLLLKDRKTKQPLGSWQEMCNIEYTPVQLKLTEPHYRASFFAFDKIEKIAGTVSLNLPPEQIPEKLHFCLRSNNKQIIAAKSINAGKTVNFELPVQSLKTGKYALEVSAGDFKFVQPVTVLPEQPGTISLSKDKAVLLDGKPFVPMGWISLEPHGYQTARENHWNVTLDYRFGSWNDTQRQNFLDQLHKHNIKAVVYCYPDSRMHSQERWRQPLSADEALAIGNFVKRWSKHPALLGWYLSDEPEGAGALPGRLEAVAEVCRKADPYHPTILLNCTINGIIKYAGISDISMPDPYPGFIAGGNAAKEIKSVTAYMQAARQGKGAEQVLWCTPQAFSWLDFNRPGQRAPEFDEMRNMHYQSVLAGTSGWFYYSWYWGAQFHPQIDYAVRYLAREVKILQNLHSSPGKLEKLTALPTDVMGGKCRIDSGEWTILVNNSTAERQVRLKADKSGYYVLGSNQKLIPQNGYLSILLKKYQTLIFCDQQLAPEAAALKMADFKQAAAAEKQKRRKPGNLLLPENGCRFTVKQNGRGQYAHELYLNNGDVHVPGYQQLKRRDSIEISWKKPQKINSIKIYGSKNMNIAVYYQENNKLKMLGQLNNDQKLDFSPVIADKVVLQIEVPDNVRLTDEFISEIEIY